MPANRNIKLYFASLRLERWPRSMAILTGFLASMYLHSECRQHAPTALLIRFFLAFLCTWMVSTANYIINEITDAPFDAFHPLKKDRPLVNRQISQKLLLLYWLFLVMLAMLAALLWFNKAFSLSLLSLLAAGIFYNVPPFRMKDIPYLDSTLESANNPIRFFIGWFSLSSRFPPAAMLACWWAFGNFLMLGKRVAEKRFLSEEQSVQYRYSLKKYSISGLLWFMALNGVAALVAFGLFAWSYHLPSLWLSMPFIAFYLVLCLRKSLQDREAAGEPERLFKDPLFSLYSLLLLFVLLWTFLRELQ